MTYPTNENSEFVPLLNDVINVVWAPCPRCKQVHEVDTKNHMQTCPYCEARWPREKNGK